LDPASFSGLMIATMRFCDFYVTIGKFNLREVKVRVSGCHG
jgi:hypothetical protein